MTLRDLRTSAIDELLARHEATLNRVAESLLEFDGHPGNRLLDGAALEGRSRERWARAREQRAGLWAQFAGFRAIVLEAREVRDRRAEPDPTDRAQLTWLLIGESVQLPMPVKPLGARRLLDAVDRMRPDAAVAAMDSAYWELTRLVVRAEQVWSSLSSTLEPLAGELERLRATLATDNRRAPGESSALAAELGRLDSRVGVLRATGFADPLTPGAGVSAAAAIAVQSEIDVLRPRVERVRALRAEFEASTAAVRDLVARVGATEAEAAELRVEVLAAIAAPVLPGQPSATPRLRAELARLDGLRGQSTERAAEVFAALERRAGTAMAAAAAAVVKTRQLLDRRDELRGRLTAYRAKADRLGLGAAPEPAARLRIAERLLWTAPCDLAASTRALIAFRRAVSGCDRTGQPPAPRSGATLARSAPWAT